MMHKWIGFVARLHEKNGRRSPCQYSGRIINTHPALLPAFGGQGFFGRKVHEAVHAAGVLESGATLHLVGSEYDTGPIIAQIKVPYPLMMTSMPLRTGSKRLKKNCYSIR